MHRGTDRVLQEGVGGGGAVVDGGVLPAVQLVQVAFFGDEADEVRVLRCVVCMYMWSKGRRYNGGGLLLSAPAIASRREGHDPNRPTTKANQHQPTSKFKQNTHHVLPRLLRLPLVRRAPVRRVDPVVRRQQRRYLLRRLALRLVEERVEEGALLYGQQSWRGGAGRLVDLDGRRVCDVSGSIFSLQHPALSHTEDRRTHRR